MIFSSKSIQDILSGKKTMTRRLVKYEKEQIEYCNECNKTDEEGWGFQTDYGAFGVIDNAFPVKCKYCGSDAEDSRDYKEINIENKPLWQVGKTYAVQNKRGGKGLWYCSKCNELVKKVRGSNNVECGYCACKDKNLELSGEFLFTSGKSLNFWFNKNGWKPLRIKITGIKKERLLDVDLNDARKEGYEMTNNYDSKNNFLINFVAINYKKIPKSIHKRVDKKQELFSERYLERACDWNPFVWVLTFEVKKCITN